MQDLGNVEVDYVTLPGWKTPIKECRSFGDLPENARNYVLKVEQLLGVKGTKEIVVFFLGRVSLMSSSSSG